MARIMTDVDPWSDTDARPPMGSAQDAVFLRMWDADAVQPGSYSNDQRELDGPWHFHDMHQVMCPLEGALMVEVAAGRHLVPCQLAAWIPAGIRHRMTLRSVKWISLFFPKHMVEDAGDRIRAVLVTPLMREMVRTAVRWPMRSEDSRLRASFFETMAGLFNEWIVEEADLFLPTIDDGPLQRAMDYTSDHLSENVSGICKSAGMSERSLRRKLKQTTGMTLNEFRSRHRLIRAVSLLGETDRPVGEIAFQCGYESPSAFSRAFRATMRETPRDYRARMRDHLQI